jgi:pimeloyl-ACP methyl ester carboxylesterase
MSRRLLALFVLGFWLAPVGLRGEVPGLQKPYFDSNGVKIHYVVKGNAHGEPVLLIHGFTVNIEAQWAPVIKALGKDYKVIAFDVRGHGGSEKPHDPKKYGPEMVKDAVRLLDHLKIDKAHVVGYSMGGDLALRMVTLYPDRVRTAVIAGKGYPPPGRERLLAAIADSLDQGKGIGPLIMALTPKDEPRPSAEQIKLVNQMILSRNDPKALAALLRSALPGKGLELPAEKVKHIRVPVLSVIGERDTLRPEVDELHRLLPDMKVVVIPKATHITAFTREEFIKAIEQFLAAHRAGKSDQ